jgi:hypothetical protein
MNMVYSRTEHVFILKHYIVSKLFAAVHEAFSIAFPDKQVPNKTTVHQLVTEFWYTRSVSVTGTYQVTKASRQLKVWLYQFQALHQLQ